VEFKIRVGQTVYTCRILRIIPAVKTIYTAYIYGFGQPYSKHTLHYWWVPQGGGSLRNLFAITNLLDIKQKYCGLMN